MNIYHFYIPPSKAYVSYPDYGTLQEWDYPISDYAYGETRGQAKAMFFAENDVTDWTIKLMSKLVAVGVPDEAVAREWIMQEYERQSIEASI